MAASNNIENNNSIISFDSNQKVDFCCACKITINAIAKKLIVEAQTQGSNKIEASFDHNFFIQKNILCVLNPKSNNIQFALIFKNDTVAKKVFDAINKTKSSNDFETHEQENNGEIFDHKFLFPLFDSIASSKTENISTQMVHDFIDSSINRKKERYIKILKEKNIYQIIFPETKSLNEVKKRRCVDSFSERNESKKIKEKDIKTENMQINEKENKSVGENEFDKSICKEEYIETEMDEDYLKDSNSNEFDSDDTNFELSEGEENFKSDLEEDEDRNNEFPALGNQRMILRPPDFILCSNKHGKPNSRLIIFDQKDRTFCYKYFKYSNDFICFSCFKKKKSNKYGVPKSVIIIFDQANRNLCYRYRLENKVFICGRCYKLGKKRTTIKLCHDDKKDENYVVVKEDGHICNLQPYISEIKNHRIIEKPDFEWQCSRQEKPKTKLIIFANSSKSLCYSYGKQNDYWYCHRCARDGVYVSVKIIKNIKGDECIEIVNENHACDPVAYMLEEKHKIIYDSNCKVSRHRFDNMNGFIDTSTSNLGN